VSTAAKIIFTINGRKERFNFKNKILKLMHTPDIHTPKNMSQLLR
jgi:hypothetical protein